MVIFQITHHKPVHDAGHPVEHLFRKFLAALQLHPFRFRFLQRTPGGFVLSLISDQHHGHIVDIRAGRAGDDEPIHRLEGMVGIVVLQHIVHVQLVLRQCRGRAAVHIAARSIGWASVPSLPTEKTAASSPAITGAAARASS